MRNKDHEVRFDANVVKIKQWTMCNDAACEVIMKNNQKIRDELDAGVIRAGGKIPERRKGDRRHSDIKNICKNGLPMEH
jgi:hypothetical protein